MNQHSLRFGKYSFPRSSARCSCGWTSPMFEPLPPPSKRPAVQIAVDAYLAHRVEAAAEQAIRFADIDYDRNFADGMNYMTAQLLEEMK